MSNNETPIPYRLIAERRRRGWSIQQAAYQLRVSSLEVRSWEQGKAVPPPNVVDKLCALFESTPDGLGLVATSREADAPLLYWPTSSRVPHPIYDPTIPLPALPLLLVDRDKEIAHVKEQLFPAKSVGLSAISGLPGVGKTSLALELVYDEQVQVHFSHGTLWASLGTNPNVQSILSRWGSTLGIRADEAAKLNGIEEWSRVLRALIGQRRFLIVLDDVWQLETALACQVGGPHCGYILTTRFPQIALAFAADSTTVLEELNEEKSLYLLTTLAPEVVEREPQQVRALVQAVGGLPLALSLIGNYLRMYSSNGVSRKARTALVRLYDAEERLQLSQRQQLSTEQGPALESDVSLQAVIALSDQQLEQEARSTLHALSVFPTKPDSFTEEAALEVSQSSSHALDLLSDAGLLESAGPGRYTLHQTIADYARFQLTRDQPATRLIAYTITFLIKHAHDFNMLERESSVILAALELAYNLRREQELIEGVTAFAPFLLARGLYDLAEKQLQRVLTLDTNENSRCFILVLRYLGEVKQRQGLFAQAETYYQDGLAFAREHDDKEQQCNLLANLGVLTEKRGMYEQAKSYIDEGFQLAQQTKNTRQIGVFLRLLGLLADDVGHYAHAKAYLLEGLKLIRDVGDPELTCALLNNIGMVSNDMGHYLQAELYLQEGLTIAQQMGYREWTVLLLLNLGVVSANLGVKEHDSSKHAQAEQYSQEGLLLARQMGNRERTCGLLINLGEMALHREDFVQADEYLQEALTLAYQIEKPINVCNALLVQGEFHLKKQSVKEAERTFRNVLASLPLGAQYQQALAFYGLARALEAQEQLQEACAWGEESLALLIAMEHENVSSVRTWLTRCQNKYSA